MILGTEIIGKDIAIVNARHAQIGRLLQAAALKAIKEKNLKLENFMQALRAVIEGVKIVKPGCRLMYTRRVYMNSHPSNIGGVIISP